MSDMEEGELSDHGEEFPPTDEAPAQHGPKSALAGRLGPKNRGGGGKTFGTSDPGFGPLQVTFNNINKDLPDLVRCVVDDDEISAVDRKVTERMEARAKRFNLENSAKYDDLVRLYDSLGIPAEEREPSKDRANRVFRLEALHVRGFGAMKAEDVYDYFKEFNPVTLEWVDGNSANVVWALPFSCAKALLALSRPLLSREDEGMEVNERVAGEDDDQNGEQDGENGENEKRSTSTRKLTKDEINSKFESGEDIYSDEIQGPLPEGRWRLGKPCPKADLVLMRIATMSDEAEDPERDQDLFRKNRELKHTGGIMSSSRKRKLQEIVQYDREMHAERESQKKYNGPVGKNPWGSIAKDWSAASRPKDFADELAMFARQRGINIAARRSAPKLVVGEDGEVTEVRDMRERLGPPAVKDWDAPEEEVENVHPIAASLHRSARRGRSASPLGEPVRSDSDEDGKWNKRLKRPRMTMVADAEETQSKKIKRKSAKDRLYSSVSGLKRRISNKSTIEVFEEDDDMEADVDVQPMSTSNLRDLRMTISTGAGDDSEATVDRRRLNERFLGQSDRGFGIVRRLGRRDSGDSLERDTGEDLRGELERGHASNMLIQVTQSDKEDEAMDDEAQDVAEERKVHRTRDASPPVRVKTERTTESVVIKKERRSSPQDSKEDVRAKIRQREREREKERLRERERRDRERDRERERQREREREHERERELARRRRDQRDAMQRRHSDRRREVERERDRGGRDRDRDRGDVARRRDPKESRFASSSALSRGKDRKSSAAAKKPARKAGVRIKKEKVTDDEDESSSSSSSSDDSSSDSDSDSGSSSSSGSSSGRSSSSSSGSDSSSSDDSSSSSDSSGDSGADKKKKLTKKRPTSGAATKAKSKGGDVKKKPLPRKDGGKKSTSDSKKGKDDKDSGGLRDKLKEYLRQAKEKRKRGEK